MWLPIDAKFPVEDYQKLVEAQERADVVAVEAAAKASKCAPKDEAKTIRENTSSRRTPPTSLSCSCRPKASMPKRCAGRGLVEALQRDQRVSIAGPTTLAAMLNSLQMGFRTLAIEKRSSEVWAVLGAIKTEFGKFGEALRTPARNCSQQPIDKAEVRTRAVTRKLKDVEAPPVPEAVALLGDDLPDEDDEGA